MRTRGLTLVEVMIGGVILLTLCVTMVLIISVGLHQLKRAKAQETGVTLAQQKIEEVVAKAPAQLTALSGPCPGQPDYKYSVAYTPNGQAPAALMDALVTVSGPLGTRVALAGALPAGGYSNLETVVGSTGGYPVRAVGIIDRSTNILHLTTWVSSSADWTTTAAGGVAHFQLGAGRVVGNFKLVCDRPDGMWVFFLDKATTPPKVVSFYFGIPADGTYTTLPYLAEQPVNSFFGF